MAAKIIDVYDNAGGGTFTTAATVNLDTERVNSGGIFTLSADTVDVAETATFLIVWRVTAYYSSGSDAASEYVRAFLERDTGGGFAIIDGSYATCDPAGGATLPVTMSGAVVVSNTSGNDYRLRAERVSGLATWACLADGSGMTIMKVSDDAGSGISNVVEDTTPQLGGQLDVNGFALGDGTLELIKFSETASAVNEVTIKNAATTNAPQIQATGDDTNISLNLVPKGTGVVQAGGVEVATISGTQTLTNKTLTTPTIASLANATHTHQNAAGGGTLDAAAIAAGTVATARLGSGVADSTVFLRGDQTWAAPAGGVSDGDKGDIDVSSSGTVWTIDAQVVTYAKIQNVSATDKLLGRSTAGAGVIEEITCTAAARSLLDDTTVAAMRTTLGVAPSDAPVFAAVVGSILAASGMKPTVLARALKAAYDAGTSTLTAAPMSDAYAFLLREFTGETPDDLRAVSLARSALKAAGATDSGAFP